VKEVVQGVVKRNRYSAVPGKQKLKVAGTERIIYDFSQRLKITEVFRRQFRKKLALS